MADEFEENGTEDSVPESPEKGPVADATPDQGLQAALEALEASNPLGAESPPPSENQAPDVGDPTPPNTNITQWPGIEPQQDFTQEAPEPPDAIPSLAFTQPEFDVPEASAGPPESLVDYLRQQEENRQQNPDTPVDGLPNMADDAFNLDDMSGDKSMIPDISSLIRSDKGNRESIMELLLDHEQRISQITRLIEAGRL